MIVDVACMLARHQVGVCVCSIWHTRGKYYEEYVTRVNRMVVECTRLSVKTKS